MYFYQVFPLLTPRVRCFLELKKKSGPNRGSPLNNSIDTLYHHTRIACSMRLYKKKKNNNKKLV